MEKLVHECEFCLRTVHTVLTHKQSTHGGLSLCVLKHLNQSTSSGGPLQGPVDILNNQTPEHLYGFLRYCPKEGLWL